MGKFIRSLVFLLAVALALPTQFRIAFADEPAEAANVIKRHQFVVMALEQCGVSVMTDGFTVPQFSDVPENEPFANAIRTAREMKIISGTDAGNNLFEPEKPMTYNMFFVMAGNLLTSLGLLPSSGGTDIDFDGSEKIAPYARECCSSLISGGVFDMDYIKAVDGSASVNAETVRKLADFVSMSSLKSGKHSKTLYYNGTIFTNDKSNPNAEAVVVEDGKFVFVGGYDKALEFAGDNCAKVDLKGQFVTPGFFDAHIHLAAAAIFGTFDFRDYLQVETPTVDQYISTLKKYLAENPNLKYLRGTGWDNTSFPGGSPTKELLDEVNSEIPIALRTLDGHSLWANSKAIEQAGITPLTKVPDGQGIIELNEKGEVKGTFREPAAMDIVLNEFPPLTKEEYKMHILKTQKMLSSVGVTGIHDAYVVTDSPWYQAYRELADSDQLKLHASIAFATTTNDANKQIEWVAKEMAKYKNDPDPNLYIQTCKFVADGVVEGGTAYLKDSYQSQPDNHGLEIWNKDKLREAFKLCDENGIRIHVHAVGDAAISTALDCMEGLSTEHRNALAHIQLVDEKDYQRFKDMGVVAVVAPYWAYRSEGYENLEVALLGEDRVEKTYPIKSFIDKGIATASHSDYPVSSLCAPLLGIEIATTRLRPESFGSSASKEPPLNPKDAVSVEQAIDIFTLGGAFANSMENITGSIVAGKSADFVVIDKNILNTPASLATVMETYFKGEKVFSK